MKPRTLGTMRDRILLLVETARDIGAIEVALQCSREKVRAIAIAMTPQEVRTIRDDSCSGVVEGVFLETRMISDRIRSHSEATGDLTTDD